MRNGECISTFSGKKFWPVDPRVEDVRIEDIAHSLSQQCRFAGHTKRFYSVAQHSVMVARIVPVEDALWGLLHDASEAYLVDLPSPIKWASRLGEEYQAIELQLMGIITQRFGLAAQQPVSVHLADRTLLATEMRDLMAEDMKCAYAPLRDVLDPWSPSRAESEFLALADLLMPASIISGGN